MESRNAQKIPDDRIRTSRPYLAAVLEVDGDDDERTTEPANLPRITKNGITAQDCSDRPLVSCCLNQESCNMTQSTLKKRSKVAPSNETKTIRLYKLFCKKLGVLPLRNVATQFGLPHVSFKNLTLTTTDMKAACLALQMEHETSSLDFTGNFMGPKELHYLLLALKQLDKVYQISLSNNNLRGPAIDELSRFMSSNSFITRLNLSGNHLNDKDAQPISQILMTNTALRTLVLSHNEFREDGGKLIGHALAVNTTLEDIDLSWNHLRRSGAVGIAIGLQANRSLHTVCLAWNGFGFEGCVALGDMLGNNISLVELDLACNRINPPALLELLRGVAANRTLRILRIGHNPITSAFSSLILAVVRKHRESGLENLDMTGVVVDKEFIRLLEEIQCNRFLIVNYELSLPVKKLSREEMRERIGLPSAFNVDPLRMLYLLKEKMRASDFFYKINKDNDEGVQRSELYSMFDESGIPVTGSVIDKIMEFMDTNKDGQIDMSEFLRGDKRIKNISRKQIKEEHERRTKDASYAKYSRTFQKAHLDPITSALKVDPSPTPMRQSRRPSIFIRLATDVNEDDTSEINIP